MSRLTRDGTAEPVSRDQILRHARGQGNIHFPCSADHDEQDWQPYPVDPYSAIICDDYTYIHTYIHTMICTQKLQYNRLCTGAAVSQTIQSDTTIRQLGRSKPASVGLCAA